MIDLVQAIRDMQAIHRSLPDVKSAPDEYPHSIAGARLPIVAVLPGPGQISSQAVGLTRESRAFHIDIFAAPLGGGDLASGVNDALRVLASVRDAWASRLHSSDVGVTGVEQISEPIEDTGISPMEFAGKTYLGSRITIRFISK